MKKAVSFGAAAIAQYIHQNNTSAIKKEAQRRTIVFNFIGHQNRQKLFSSTVPTWDRTMDARFPHNFVFWALSNAHN